VGGSGAAIEDGYDYVVQSGDRLDKIVARYRAEKIMVTSKAVIAANPTVEWSRLQVGQHIFIPKPK
jgi:LysM repeat protein